MGRIVFLAWVAGGIAAIFAIAIIFRFALALSPNRADSTPVLRGATFVIAIICGLAALELVPGLRFVIVAGLIAAVVLRYSRR